MVDKVLVCEVEGFAEVLHSCASTEFILCRVEGLSVTCYHLLTSHYRRSEYEYLIFGEMLRNIVLSLLLFSP